MNTTIFLNLALATGLIVLAPTALAEDKLIIPKVGSSCPSGFRTDGDYCVQYAKLPQTHHSRNDYIEKRGTSCPSGYRTDGSGYCIRYAK